MNELIPIQDNNGTQAVMGRDLHAFLEVQSNYREWFPRMVAYGFEEGKDYASKNRRVQDSLGREREANDHIVSLDMAKEISMIQRTEKGKQARQYFIECERRVKDHQATPALPQDYASALRELASTVEAKELAEEQEREQRELAEKRARAIEAQAPAVAKAQAHSGVAEWKGKQNFAREVQQWGDLQGMDIKQANVIHLLARRGMYIAAGRSDSGQVKRDAVRAGWGKNEKGVADNGHAYTRPLISPKGQDVAWKWIVKAVAEYGQELNPKEIV